MSVNQDIVGKSILTGINFKTLSLSFLLLVWFSTFFFNNVGFAWLPRGVEIILFAIALIGGASRKSVLSITELLFLLYVCFLITLSLAIDKQAAYSTELYLKTFGFVFFSVLLGYSFNLLIDNSPSNKTFFIYFAKLAAILMISWVAFAYFFLSWRPGNTLIGSSFGQYYQGISRILALYFLAVICFRWYFSKVTVAVVSVVFLLMLLAFNSFGAALVLLVAFLFLAFSKGKALSVFARTAILIALGVSVILFLKSSSYEAYEAMYNRYANKVTLDDEVASRPWLIKEGVRLWLSNAKTFLVGAGPMRYACEIGYCESYRHPHNFFVMILVWFGLLGAPLIFFVVYMVRKAISLIVENKSDKAVFVSSLLLYYFSLSMFGGDFEQNRYLIFVLTMFWFYLKDLNSKHLLEKAAI